MSVFMSAIGAVVVVAAAGMGMPLASGPAPVASGGETGARYDVLGHKSTPQESSVVRVVMRVEVRWVEGEMKVTTTIEDIRFEGSGSEQGASSTGRRLVGAPVQRQALGAIQDVP